LRKSYGKSGIRLRAGKQKLHKRSQLLFEKLAQFYHEVDQRVTQLTDLHAKRLKCQLECTDCCIDGITVFEVEAENIRYYYAKPLKEDAPHPEGTCAFLDKKGNCRIYPHRPYVCRTQGLPLRWIEEQPDGSIIEMRDICPLNEKGKPLENIPAHSCLSIGCFERRLAELQSAFSGGKLRRVPLRDLFTVR
jgi:hypothetical protein